MIEIEANIRSKKYILRIISKFMENIRVFSLNLCDFLVLSINFQDKEITVLIAQREEDI